MNLSCFPESKVILFEQSFTINYITHAICIVVRCPALPKPKNGRKSENKYWPGIEVRFTCDTGYRLVGNEYRLCRGDGLWSWGYDAFCVSMYQLA